jgi:hypothetical protein
MCGAVEYEVADAFLYAAYCHCSRCRAATGAAAKPFAGIEKEKVAITRGEATLLAFGSKGNSDVRCATCGSYLYCVLSGGVRIHVSLGSLVDAPTIAPREHIFVGSKAPWEIIADDGLPRYVAHADGPLVGG